MARSLTTRSVTAHLLLEETPGPATNASVTVNIVQAGLDGGRRLVRFSTESSDGIWEDKEMTPRDYLLTARSVEFSAEVPFTVPGDPPSGTLSLGDITLKPDP